MTHYQAHSYDAYSAILENFAEAWERNRQRCHELAMDCIEGLCDEVDGFTPAKSGPNWEPTKRTETQHYAITVRTTDENYRNILSRIGAAFAHGDEKPSSRRWQVWHTNAMQRVRSAAMAAPTLSGLRSMVKEIDERNTAAFRDGEFIISTPHNYDEVKRLIRDVGLRLVDDEISGSRWNWKHVFRCVRD